MNVAEEAVRRERILDAVAAVSLANLCLLLVWRELLFASDGDRYLMLDFSSAHYLAALANVVWLSLTFWLGARAFRRWRWWPIRLVLSLALLLVLAGPIYKYVRLAAKIEQRQVLALLDGSASSILLALTLVGVVLAALRYWRVSLRMIHAVLLLLAPFALLNLTQAAWASLTVGGPAVSGAPSGDAVAGPHGDRRNTARVLWLIFDELDWRLGFERRPAHVRMPEFSRLASQSVIAAAQEASAATVEAIPSLTIGHAVRQAERVDDRRLELHVDGYPHKGWSEWPTVFSEARKLGSRSAIFGFYHPYCRVFSGEYRECKAFPLDVAHMDADESFFDIMVAQLLQTAPLANRALAISRYRELVARTQRSVADPRIDFVYAHVPVPHAPNIWDARRSNFTVLNLNRHGYLDNLELADKFLGDVRRTMEAAGVWDRTAVVVMADHGWRFVSAIGGKRDRRVPLLVKLPGQRTRLDVTAKVDAATTAKQLVISLIRGELSEPRQLMAFLERGHPASSSSQVIEREPNSP